MAETGFITERRSRHARTILTHPAHPAPPFLLGRRSNLVHIHMLHARRRGGSRISFTILRAGSITLRNIDPLAWQPIAPSPPCFERQAVGRPVRQGVVSRREAAPVPATPPRTGRPRSAGS